MRKEIVPCVYILASGHNGSLYVGATSNQIGRIIQHREGKFEGHTNKYGIVRLVYFEMADTMDSAITREKKLKRWRRDGKRNLIERQNPAWNDLAVGLGLKPLASSPGGTMDPGTSPGHGTGLGAFLRPRTCHIVQVIRHGMRVEDDVATAAASTAKSPPTSTIAPSRPGGDRLQAGPPDPEIAP